MAGRGFAMMCVCEAWNTGKGASVQAASVMMEWVKQDVERAQE